jgi:hypothetical protein
MSGVVKGRIYDTNGKVNPKQVMPDAPTVSYNEFPPGLSLRFDFKHCPEAWLEYTIPQKLLLQVLKDGGFNLTEIGPNEEDEDSSIDTTD